MAYLEDLTVRLVQGAAHFDSPLRERHAQWLLARQGDDGGFAGREGASDLYYTGFALRSLMILGVLDGSPAERAAEFLRSQLPTRQSVVDLISLIFGSAVLDLSAGIQVLADAPPRWRSGLSELLEQLRRDDGGYAKSPEGRAGSTYQTFLTLLCYELIELQPPEPATIVEFLHRQQHVDGGFLEIRVAKRPGVNPTAAAIGSLRVLQSFGVAGALDEVTARRTVEFLVDMQSDEGGLAANTRIPLADLLSTCTGLITLTDLAAADRVNRDRLANYARSMERPDGGFAGFAMDPSEDVEYTFYGLATLALCARG